MTITYATIDNIVTSPSGVTTSDGRTLTFNYTLATKTTISDGTRQWIYDFAPIANFTGIAGSKFLTRVTRPDGQTWNYDYYTPPDYSDVTNRPGLYSIKRVTYPTGGTLSYTFSYLFPGIGMPRAHVTTGKLSSDAGTWTYAYQPATTQWPFCAPNTFCIFDMNNNPEQFDQTTVTAPEGTTRYFHFGYNSAYGGTVYLIGSLLGKSLAGSQSESYSYTAAPIAQQPNQRPYAFTFDDNTYAPRVIAKYINRYGQNYSTQFSNFDYLGNPGTIVETGTATRTTTLTYFVNPSKWIIHRKKDEVTDTIGTISRGFDLKGNLQSENRYGVTTAYAYTIDGDVLSKTDANGNVVAFPVTSPQNYKRGIPRLENQPESVSISRVVSDAGNVVSQTDGEGNITGYGYDGLNRLTSITHPIGNPVAVTWNSNNRVVTRGGYTETTQYDGFGRALSVQHTGGAGGPITQSYVYDATGRRRFASYPNSTQGAYFGFDILGLPKQIIHGFTVQTPNPITGSGIFGRTYDYVGNTLVLANERNKTFTYTFRAYGDPDRRDLMSVTAPVANASLAIQRNGVGQMTAVTQEGKTRSYGYDGRFFMMSSTEPETGTTNYGRDNLGNMIRRQVGAGPNVAMVYDRRNRLTTITYPAPSTALSVVRDYFKTDKPKLVDNGVARRDYIYNPNLSLTQETLALGGQSFVIGYSYDNNDALGTLTYGSGRVVSYAPDALGWPTQATPYLTAVSHHPTGQTSGITYANGVQTTTTFNALNWPNTQSIVTGTAVPPTKLYFQGYGYDGNGNVTAIVDGVDTRYNRGMGYDDIDRLIAVNGPWGMGGYSYDGRGNILAVNLGTSSLDYSYNLNSELLTQVKGTKPYSLSYDGYGNVVGNGTTTFSYDDASTMRCAKCGLPDEIAYDYDGLNQRVRARQNGATTNFVYDSSGKLLWEQAAGAGLKEYVYLDGKQIAVRQLTP